jgi:phosphoenolpyruvate carboxylase
MHQQHLELQGTLRNHIVDKEYHIHPLHHLQIEMLHSYQFGNQHQQIEKEVVLDFQSG